MKTLSISRESLAHHLEIAAKRYEADARECAEEPFSTTPTFQRLREQFERQAKECREIAGALGQGPGITYAPVADMLYIDTEE